MKYNFSDNCLDTMVYFLEEGIRKLNNEKITKGLCDIDIELLKSAKECRKVLLTIENKRNESRGSFLDETNKKKVKKARNKIT